MLYVFLKQKILYSSSPRREKNDGGVNGTVKKLKMRSFFVENQRRSKNDWKPFYVALLIEESKRGVNIAIIK